MSVNNRTYKCFTITPFGQFQKYELVSYNTKVLPITLIGVVRPEHATDNPAQDTYVLERAVEFSDYGKTKRRRLEMDTWFGQNRAGGFPGSFGSGGWFPRPFFIAYRLRHQHCRTTRAGALLVKVYRAGLSLLVAFPSSGVTLGLPLPVVQVLNIL